MGAPELRTDRLVLRAWRDDDRVPFAAMNADPLVMEHFPAPLSRAESDAFVDAAAAGLARRSYGLWALEVRGGAPFVGFVGLNAPAFRAAFTPCVEVGWRLAREHWGRGYATEAAVECLRHAFVDAGLDEIVSFTAVANRRSRAVMERLGMRRSPTDDFEHPRLPAGHPIRRHVLYRLARADWQAASRPRPRARLAPSRAGEGSGPPAALRGTRTSTREPTP